MCDICGCDGDGKATATNLQTGRTVAAGGRQLAHVHEHVHADGTVHSHAHEGAHLHIGKAADGPTSPVIPLETRVLARNDALAAENRNWLAKLDVFALNLMGAPGAGKTSLLERTIRDTRGTISLSVIEGDQATSHDGERIRAAGAAVVQVNTGTGCHLEAGMVARALTELKPAHGSIVIVENVGNLVCPALFDLGEARRVVIYSVTEGEDKPVKYPHMFHAADLVLLNKIDLLPHIDFDVDRAIADVRAINPGCEILPLSARSGEGMEEWYRWLTSARRTPELTQLLV